MGGADLQRSKWDMRYPPKLSRPSLFPEPVPTRELVAVNTQANDLTLAAVVVVLGAVGTYLLLPHGHGAAKPRRVHAVRPGRPPAAALSGLVGSRVPLT